MTTTHPFSLRLDPELKARLEQAAKQADRSASYMAVQAIRQFLDAQQAKHDAIEAALKEADAGEFISSEAMNNWVDQWGAPDEAPPRPDITEN